MPAVRRSTDSVEEDHFHNGDRETDWKKNTPRSWLIVIIYALLGACTALGSFSYWALTEQINTVRAEVRDQRWNTLTEQAYDIGELKRRAKQSEDLANEMRELRREFDGMNLRLRKKGI